MSKYSLTIETEYAWHVGTIALLAEAITDGNLSVGFEGALNELFEAVELACQTYRDANRYGEIAKIVRKWADELETDSEIEQGTTG